VYETAQAAGQIEGHECRSDYRGTSKRGLLIFPKILEVNLEI